MGVEILPVRRRVTTEKVYIHVSLSFALTVNLTIPLAVRGGHPASTTFLLSILRKMKGSY